MKRIIVGVLGLCVAALLAVTSAASGSTSIARLASNDDVSRAPASPCTLAFSGAPLDGHPLALRFAQGTAEAGTNNPSAGVVAAGQTNVPMLQLALSASAVEDLSVSSFTITDVAAAAAAALVSAVRLWEDVDGSGTVTPGDVLLSADKAFTAGTPTIDLAATSSSMIAAGTSKQYLVTYDFAAAPSSSLSPLAQAERVAGYLMRALLAPLTIAGCSGGDDGGASAGSLSNAPENFVFTDEDGNAITSALSGTVVQVRSADGAKVLQFTMGSQSVSFDGVTLDRDAGGTLVALGVGGATTLSLAGVDKAATGLPDAITAFVPCDDDDNRVLVCPAAGTVPEDSLTCPGPLLLASGAATSGGYTWSNTDRTGNDDCSVTGTTSLFKTFYGKGVTATVFQASVSAMTDLALKGGLSDLTMHPAGVPISGGAMAFLAE